MGYFKLFSEQLLMLFFFCLQRVPFARLFILVVAPQNVARAAVGTAMMRGSLNWQLCRHRTLIGWQS
jgi:hypothetical protein